MENPQRTARFVLWADHNVRPESNESDLLLSKLGFRSLTELKGLNFLDLQADLGEEASFFLEYSGLGKLCTAVPQILLRAAGTVTDATDHSIVTLRLSVRASNCLKSAGILTIAELMRWTPEELLDLPSMGRKTLDELISTLAAHGITSSSPTTTFEARPHLFSKSPPVLAEGEFILETLLTLEQSGMSEELASRLRSESIRTLGDLAQCRGGKLRVAAELLSEELIELADILRRYGLHWGLIIPPWHREHGAELSETFILEIHNSIQNAPTWSAQSEIPPPIIDVAASLTEELETLFPKKADERDRMIVKAYWGLDGEFPLTLEETAQRYSLTRERVRQIGKSFYHSIGEYGRHLPWLEEIGKILQTLSPCSADEAESTLAEREIVHRKIRVEGLLKLMQAAGIEHTLVIEGEKRLLLHAEAVDVLKTAVSHAGKMISHWGVAEKTDVLMTASVAQSDKVASLVWDAMLGLVWLDPEKTFLWFPTGKNAVENRLISILRIAPDVSLSEAYEAVMRDGRVSRERLPFRVFAALCQQYSWCKVKEGRLLAAPGLPPGEQDSHHNMIVGFLRETSGVAWRDDLWERANAAGIGKPSFDRILSDSCVIVRHAVSLYGLIGTAVPVVQDTRLNELHQYVEADELEQAKDLETSAVVAELLSGLDPNSRLFPFQVMRAIWEKSAAFETSWSIAELRLTQADIDAIRLWGRSGAVNLRRDIRKIETVGQMNVRGVHAICLTFLLFCSEVAREDGIEGELWPTIKSALSESMGQAFFGRAVVPKALVRDGTEDLCRLLRIRHVFGREGEQSWLRTVFLQFGFTRRGIRGIDRWLIARESVPVAVDDLLSSSGGLKSESFVLMWQTLQELRWRTIDTPKAAIKLRNNPWLRSEDQALAFSEAQSTRRRESSADESDSEKHYCLLTDKRLRLLPEPCFEFLLNPFPPDWCRAERYTLEVGQQRLPISRTIEGWQFDHSQILSVPMTSTTVEIDLMQRRQSVMQQKLLLSLLPVTETAFFDLGSGLELDLDKLSTHTNRGVVILHRSSVKMQPDAPEFLAVFDGSWRLAIFRHGIPHDLTLTTEERTVWQPAVPKTELTSTLDSEVSVRLADGWWGDYAAVRVALSPEAGLQPKTLIVSGQTITLAPRRPGEWVGQVCLLPSQGKQPNGSLFCEESGWIRRQSVPISAIRSYGVAVEGEDSWITLTNKSDIDVQWLQRRKMLIHPPAYEGLQRDLREWALLEGDRLVARPRHSNEPLQGLEALGEELSLAYGPYNSYGTWHSFARSVTDSGCIRAVVGNGEGRWVVELGEAVGLGADHALWIWKAEDNAPERLARSSWEEANGQIFCNVPMGTVLGFAVSFQYLLLGSKAVHGAWTGLRHWIESHTEWRRAAEWLRWWRIPIRHPELRTAVEEKVRRNPLETLQAWLTDPASEDGPKFLEANEESWQTMARICLWGWRPNAPECAQLLKSLNLWKGDFQYDAECENFDFLLATNPMLLAQMARKGAPLLYEGAPKRDLAALIRCLRNRVLEPREGLRWQDTYNATCLAAATDLNVDDRFLQKSVIEDARRYVRGDVNDQRNLKLALGSMLLRRIVGSRLLEDTAEEWTQE